MKKFISGLLTLAMLAMGTIPAVAQNNTYREFYVSQSGSDQNPGTKAKPFKTLQAAQAAVRAVNQSMTGDIIVNIGEGTYYLEEMLDMGTLDSGYNGHRVIWQGIGKKAPVISGGTPVSGFSDTDGDGIYTADLSEYGINYVYQLSVNGTRRYMAKAATLAYGQTGTDGSYYYDDPEVDYDGTQPDKDTNGDYISDQSYPDHEGIYVSKKDIGFYDNAEDMFFAWNRGFYASYIPVRKIKEDPDNSAQLRVLMCERYDGLTEAIDSRIAYQSSTAPYADRGFIIMNAMELLDEPGEFYFNKKTKELHYMPAKDEDMTSATVVVPKMETLLFIDGNDVSDKVKNLTFTNLHFTDSEWDITGGFTNSQSNDATGNGQNGISPNAVMVMRADGIEFTDNIFSNTGAGGLNYYNAVSDSTIIGNTFYDIGATAIASGAFHHNHNQVKSGTNKNRSTPVPPANKNDPVDVVDEITTKVTVSSNYGVSITPVQVPVTDGSPSQHNWYYAVSSGAIQYPGAPHPDDGGWTKPGSYHKINVTWADYKLLAGTATQQKSSQSGYKGIWRSNPELEDGNSYALFEFARPYSLSKISVSFDERYIEEGENADYEILVSNDKSFEDYEVWATQKGVALSGTTVDEINHYTNESLDGKYKYMMIRKLDKKPLVLSRVWAASYDRKPYVKNERCADLTISNNLVKRAGVSTTHSVGIIITSGDRHTVTHNEVYHVGYSGMSIGYNWGATTTCTDMQVSYNYFYDTCRTSHDGSGMYQLGPQPGSEYSYNYIEKSNQSAHGFYTDNGSSLYTIKNNYMDNCQVILCPYVGSGKSWTDGCVQYKTSNGTKLHCTAEGKYYYHSGSDKADTALSHNGEYSGTDAIPVGADSSIHDCVFRTNFGTHLFSSDAGKKFNDYEEPILELVGLPSREAYQTYQYAGLEDNYKHLHDVVPDNEDNLYELYTHTKNSYDMDVMRNQWTSISRSGYQYSMATELGNILKYGRFGNGLGMYPVWAKEKINNMFTFFSNAADEEFISRWSIVQELRSDIKNMVRRYSVAETIEMCQALVDSAAAEGSGNLYPPGAIEEAKTALEEVKSMSEQSATEEYDKLIAAEEVYNNLLSKKYSAEIISVSVPEADDIKINNFDETVTIYMPYGSSLTVKDIKIIVDENSILYSSISGEQDLSEGVIVPVFCKGNGKFRTWQIKTVYSEPKTMSTLTPYVWQSIVDGNKRIREGVDKTVLAGNHYAYVATEYANSDNGDGATINFKPISPNETKKFSMMFGINSPDSFVYGSKSNDSDYFELEFDGDKVTFYLVTDGERTVIEEKSSVINWNGENTVTYQMSFAGTKTTINISLNDTTFAKSVSQRFGRYAGVYTPDLNVMVY